MQIFSVMQQSEHIIASDPDQTLYSGLQLEVDIGVQALQGGNAALAVTLFQSSLQKLTTAEPFYDHLVHNLLFSYKMLIEQLFKKGHVARAVDFLRSALNFDIAGEMSGDPDFLKRFAHAFQDLGLVFFKHRLLEESILCFRKSIAIHQTPGAHVNLSNSLAASGLPSMLSDFTTGLTREEIGRHIFIACVPKSASTFLKNILLSLSGYRDVFMVYAAGQNEHDLYLPTVLETAHLDSVTQQHCRASNANVQLMQAFGIRPVVLVRNIFDSVMSLLDFYNGGAFHNSYFQADFESLDEEMKTDLLIDNIIPWYFQFVASWDFVEKQKRLELYWLSYEDLISDKTTSIQSVLKFYGLGASKRSIGQKLAEAETQKRNNRFNKGVAGRGKTGINDRQKENIRRLARYYPSTDFARIGL